MKKAKFIVRDEKKYLLNKIKEKKEKDITLSQKERIFLVIYKNYVKNRETRRNEILIKCPDVVNAHQRITELRQSGINIVKTKDSYVKTKHGYQRQTAYKIINKD